MDLATAIDNRDAMIIATIKGAFVKAAEGSSLDSQQILEMLELIECAYRRGAQDWDEDYLPTAVGSDQAGTILQHITHK